MTPVHEHGYTAKHNVLYVSFILAQDSVFTGYSFTIPIIVIFMCDHNFPLNLNLLYDLIAPFLVYLSGDSSKKSVPRNPFCRGYVDLYPLVLSGLVSS